VKWYGVNTDIEDRRRATVALCASQEQLERIRAELARVSRVTTLGVLLHGRRGAFAAPDPFFCAMLFKKGKTL
jgi:hypothetical protein